MSGAKEATNPREGGSLSLSLSLGLWNAKHIPSGSDLWFTRPSPLDTPPSSLRRRSFPFPLSSWLAAACPLKTYKPTNLKLPAAARRRITFHFHFHSRHRPRTKQGLTPFLSFTFPFHFPFPLSSWLPAACPLKTYKPTNLKLPAAARKRITPTTAPKDRVLRWAPPRAAHAGKKGVPLSRYVLPPRDRCDCRGGAS